MRLTFEKVRTSKHYRVGYIRLINEYAMAITKEGNDGYYDVYFRISPNVYQMHKNELERLDLKAQMLEEEGKESEEFLFSEKDDDNTVMQKEIYLECRDSQKDSVNGEFERI